MFRLTIKKSNIDVLGSFDTARCMVCKHHVNSNDIKDDIFSQRIPYCPVCPPPENPISVESYQTQKTTSDNINSENLPLQSNGEKSSPSKSPPKSDLQDKDSPSPKSDNICPMSGN